MAICAVSWSRISPMSTMSGSDRRIERSADGEGQAGLGVDLHLVDAGQPVLDRVLDGDDVDLGLVDDVQRRVQRRRLARNRSGR